MLLFVILDTKYGITTYLNFLSIANFCSIIVTLTIWITSNSWQVLSYKIKRQSILAHKYQIISYLIFLRSGNCCSTKFEPFWLFELVTVDNLLATKKKSNKGITYLLTTNGITYLPQLPSSSSSFLSINIAAFWLPMTFDNQQSALCIAP